MSVFGVDPPNGCAVVNGDRMLGHLQWSKKISDAELAAEIENAVTSALFMGADVLAIEGQFGPWLEGMPEKKRRGITRSIIVLSNRAGMWEQEWRRQSRAKHGKSLPVVRMQPGEWRKPVLGRGAPKQSKPLNAYIIIAMSAVYRVKLKEDEANATGIARAVSVGCIAVYR